MNVNNIQQINFNPKSSLKSLNSSIINRYTTTYAIKKGYFNLVRFLLSSGIDPNYVDEKETNQRTSLIYATFIKDEIWCMSVAQNLLEFGANLKQTDSKFLNPIHYCCAFGREKLLELFLQSLDFDLSRAIDINGNTCLHYAVRSHNKKIVEMIVNKLKNNYMTRIEIKNVYGLKATDLEDDDDVKEKSQKYYLGRDSLPECKNPIEQYKLYIEEQKLKQAKLKQEKMIPVENIKKKTKKKKGKKASQKTKSNKKLSLKDNDTGSKQSIDAILETELENKVEFLDGNNNQFFKTELEDDKFTGGIKKQSQTIKPSDKKLQNRTITSQFVNNIHSDSKKFNSDENSKNETFFIKKIFINKETSLDDLIKKKVKIPTQKEIASFTSKSFLLTIKELEENSIEYNSLFYAKEYLLKPTLTNQNCLNVIKKKENQVKKRCSSAAPSSTHQDALTNSLMTLPNQFENTDWKLGLPIVFNQLENFLTKSFRETIRPPLSTKVKNPQKYQNELRRALSRLDRTYSRKNSAFQMRKRENSVFQTTTFSRIDSPNSDSNSNLQMTSNLTDNLITINI